MPLELTCTNEEKILITVSPVTASGKPTKLDGPATVDVTSGEGGVSMVDDTSFFVVSPDVPGVTTYLVRGDSDLGGGVVMIADTISLNVTSVLASSLGISAGPAVPK